MLIVRKACPEDMKDVLELIQELAVFEREPEAVILTESDLIRDGFGGKPLFDALVAVINNEVFGMALYYARYSTWKGKTLHLEDLVVTERERGTGAGQALFSAVVKEAKEQGVKRMEWVVLSWNHPAIRFYEAAGAHVSKEWNIVQMDEEALANFS